MAFFEELGKKAQAVAGVAAEKAKDLAGVASEKAKSVSDSAKASMEISPSSVKWKRITVPSVSGSCPSMRARSPMP